MKILLVKRLESSFRAFRLTVGRFIRSYERVIAEFQKGHVYISKKHINKIFDLLESDDDEAIQRFLDEDKADKLSAKLLRRLADGEHGNTRTSSTIFSSRCSTTRSLPIADTKLGANDSTAAFLF